MILERLGKCEEALSVIRGPLGGINTVYTLNRHPFQFRLYFQFDIYRTVHIKGAVHQIKRILPQPGHNQSKAAMLWKRQNLWMGLLT